MIFDAKRPSEGNDMCKVLVIEKNKNIVEELMVLLKQSHFNLDLILCSDTYQKAFDLSMTHNPDLIITMVIDDLDISFPCIEKLKELNPNANFLLLIDENNPQLLKTTLRKRNERFILKPIDSHNFLKIIHECISDIYTIKYDLQIINDLVMKIQQYTPMIEHNIIHHIVTNAPQEFLLRDFNLLNYTFGEGILHIIPKQIYQKNLMEDLVEMTKFNHVQILSSDYNNYYIILTFTAQQFSPIEISLIQDFLKHINNLGIPIISSPIIHKLSSLYYSFVGIAENLSTKSQNHCQLFEIIKPAEVNINEISLDQYAHAITRSFLLMDDGGARATLQQIALTFSLFDHDTGHVLLQNYIQKLNNIINYSYKTSLTYENIVYSSNDSFDIHKILIEHYEFINKKIQRKQMDIPHTHLRKVLFYILKHYTNTHISLNDAAHHLQLSTFYICKLFKTYTNFTFIDYVNECRIEYAKNQLKTDKKIKNIAYDAGYQSTTYFGRVFKQRTGNSPKSYRTQQPSVFPL